MRECDEVKRYVIKQISHIDLWCRYDISRKCHTVLLNMTYLSVRYDFPRECHTEGSKGACITRYEFSKKSHAA